MVQIIIHINKNFATLFWQSGHSTSSGSMEWQTSYKSQFWQSGLQISPLRFCNGIDMIGYIGTGYSYTV